MAQVTGREEILKNLREQGNLLRRGIIAGTIDVSTTVEKISNDRTPRDTGFLRLSSFTATPDVRKRVIVGRVGYTAAYAAYVHEMPITFRYKEPNTGPKFLEKAVTLNTKRLTDTFYNTVTRFIKAWR